MNPAWFVLQRYAPYVTFPIAFLIGVVGYNIEGLIRDKKSSSVESFDNKRSERKLNELETIDPLKVQSLKEKRYSSVLDKNLSPSLS